MINLTECCIDFFLSELSYYWYSFVKLGSFESALICVKAMSYELK